MSEHYKIAEVSRVTGIPKDLLRMWERRYGYPDPTRDDSGDRIYSGQQLEKLMLIRQLMDQGRRPGKLVSLDPHQLESLLREPTGELDADELVRLLKSRNATELRVWLHRQLAAHGLRAFIHRVMAPATRWVGEAWAKGELAIHEEHLYTEMIKGLLRQSMPVNDGNVGRPRVMLTTVPGEQHSLGLLMVEALLRLGGAEPIAFGTEMPFKDIKEAALEHRVDVIGLSFSSSFKTDDALVILSGLRQMVDRRVGIWAGGEAFGPDCAMPDGVVMLHGLHGVERALTEWKRLRLAGAAPPRAV